MHYTKKLSESNVLEVYGNDATNSVLAGLCESVLPGECYKIENRYEVENCSVRLFRWNPSAEIPYDDDDEVNSEAVWLDVQRAIDWDEDEVISVDVDDETDAEDAWRDAAIRYVNDAGIRDDKFDELAAELRSICGVPENN